MKILVVSDIHANIWALEAVLQKEGDYDFLIFAGDIVDYGIAPGRVIEWLQSVPNKAVVMGNHDAHAVCIRDMEPYDNMPNEQYKWIHYNLQRMTQDQIHYLNNLEEYAVAEADGWVYLITHSYGGSYQVIESSAQFEAFWREHMPEHLWGAKQKRIVFGHTHRQGIHILEEGMEWLNPGSVSYRRPDDPDKTAHYAVIENGRIMLKRISYNREPQREEALRLLRGEGMMKTELQDFLFFFGDALTSRDELPVLRQE